MPDSVSSIDGRTFQAPGLDGPDVPGDLVVLRIDSGERVLGQLLDVRTQDGAVVGSGVIVGALGADGQVVPGHVTPFVDASVSGA